MIWKPLLMPDEVTAVFTVTGSVEELQQVEMYLNSIGVEFKRED